MFERACVDRLVRSALAAELGRLTGKTRSAAAALQWAGDTRIDEDGLGLDSLQRLEAIATLNTFLHLHESGIEDYLVVAETLDAWVDLCTESLQRTLIARGGADKATDGVPDAGGDDRPPDSFDGALTFLTSGTTGRPTPHTHRIADLIAEIDSHLRHLGEVRRVVAATPPHHIYGFLFSVLLPWRAGIPVLEARAIAPSGLPARTRPGDLVIATPYLWTMITAGTCSFPEGVTGVSSGAPAAPDQWTHARNSGLDGLLEVYGSTETAGLGWRDAPDTGFAPLDHLTLRDSTLFDRHGRPIEAPDRLDTAGGQFRPAGRRDGAVQVGGVNVWPRRVVEVIEAHPRVAEATVRLEPDLGRLKAFVVPKGGGDLPTLESDLREHVRDWLSAPERPAHFRFGPKLPRNEIGKLADWARAAGRTRSR